MSMSKERLRKMRSEARSEGRGGENGKAKGSSKTVRLLRERASDRSLQRLIDGERDLDSQGVLEEVEREHA